MSDISHFLPPRSQHDSEYAQYDTEFCRFLKSSNAAIILRKICAWVTCLYKKGQMINDTKHGLGWIYLTIEDIEEQTGLTRDMQDTAIEILCKHGLIEKKVFGLPPRRHFRINKDAIEKMEKDCEALFQKKNTNLRESHKLICGNPANSSAVLPQIPHNIEPSKKPSKKQEKEKKIKIKFRDFVELTQEEHDKLLADVKKDSFDQMLDMLDSYKGSKGITYDSDYHVMKKGGWVRRELERNTKENLITKTSNAKAFADNIAKSYNSINYEIDVTHEAIIFIPLIGQQTPTKILFKDGGLQDQVMSFLKKKEFNKNNPMESK